MKTNSYELVFISTCTDSIHIHNLCESVIKYNKYIRIGLIIFLQNNVQLKTYECNSDFVSIHILSSNILHSLSNARNICLEYYVRNCFSSKYIMFPDDDTTFDESFFMNFSKIVTSNMLIDVLCEGTREPYVTFKDLKDGEYTACYKHAMSVNMIVKSDNALEIGGFDESLGVGARYGAGEDGDYFIRVCKQFGPFKYTNQLWNYHPSADSKYSQISLIRLLKRYKTYGEGVIYLLLKHKMYFEAIKCVLSGFAGAIIAFFLNFNIKLSIARFYGGMTRFSFYLKFLLKKS